MLKKILTLLTLLVAVSMTYAYSLACFMHNSIRFEFFFIEAIIISILMGYIARRYELLHTYISIGMLCGVVPAVIPAVVFTSLCLIGELPTIVMGLIWTMVQIFIVTAFSGIIGGLLAARFEAIRVKDELQKSR